MNMKIRNKIFLNLFSLSLATLLIVVGFVYFFSRNIVISNIGSYNYLLAQNEIDSVDRFIDRRLERWQSYVGSNENLLEALKQSNDQFANMIGRDEFISEQDEAWKKIEKTAVTPFMETILENSISDGLRLRTKFYEGETGYKIFPEFFITNRYGVLVASTNKTTDYLQSDEEWWQRAVSEGVWVNDVSLDTSSGVNSLEFCIRIDNLEGDFVGVAKVVYDIKDVFGIVEKANESSEDKMIENLGFTRKTTVANLLTKDGKLIYSTKDGYGNLIDSELFLLANQMLSIGSKPFLIRMDEGVEELYSTGVSKGSGNFGGLGWTLIIEKETQEVLAPLNSLIKWLLFIVFVIFVLISVVGWWLSLSFVRPIKKLIDDVEQVENGNLNLKINSLTHDEIGQLHNAFGDMVMAVKKSRQDVDRKVEEQTAEINQKATILADQQKAILNILEDVEAEKDRVARERDKMNIILHSIGDGVFVVDKDYKIILFNEVAEKISGFSIEEVMGKPYGEVLKFLSEKDEKINDEFIRDAVSSGEIKQMANHTVLVQKDGNRVPVADSAAPFKDKNGKVIGCVIVFRDVTKEREIDQMKTEFVSVASHQLRTPLTGIKWFAELLLKNKLDDTTRDYITQISISNQRMVHLVDDLLNVSRIDTGRKFDINLLDIDIVPLVKSVIEEQMPGATEKHVSISCAIDAPHKLILAVDELKIRQVFQNLISNSIKYSKENTTIVVGCKQEPKEVTFYVKDGGIGIPKHQQNQIFKKFFRAENVFTVHTDGTGLGLYIVKAIVEAHGGKVWFESEENKGTTFYFSLPFKAKKSK